MVPIPKCSSPSIPSHYRPISILPTASTIFEKIVYARVSNFLNKNKLFTNFQYGFRNNASTELAASAIYESFLENVDKGKSTCAVFLDLSKAFDTADRDAGTGLHNGGTAPLPFERSGNGGGRAFS